MSKSEQYDWLRIWLKSEFRLKYFTEGLLATILVTVPPEFFVITLASSVAQHSSVHLQAPSIISTVVNAAASWVNFSKILSPLVILSSGKTMVTKVISELKSVSRLKILPEYGPWPLFHKASTTSLHGLTGLRKDVIMFLWNRALLELAAKNGYFAERQLSTTYSGWVIRHPVYCIYRGDLQVLVGCRDFLMGSRDHYLLFHKKKSFKV